MQYTKVNERMGRDMAKEKQYGKMVVNTLAIGISSDNNKFNLNRVDDQANGHGKLIHADGDIYEGE